MNARRSQMTRNESQYYSELNCHPVGFQHTTSYVDPVPKVRPTTATTPTTTQQHKHEQ
jgi:hypothetical protein